MDGEAGKRMSFSPNPPSLIPLYIGADKMMTNGG